MLLFELFNFNTLKRQVYKSIKLANENSGIIIGNLKDTLVKLNESLKAEISDVSEKFNIQLQQLISQNENIEENINLQERIKKASGYFAEKTETVIINKIANLRIETDNKAVRKAVNDVMEKLLEEANIKLSCFKVSRDWFFVKNYLETRAKAAIEIPEIKPPLKTPEKFIPGDLIHQELYDLLKQWREIKSQELDKPAFFIMHNKTIAELTHLLPSTLAGLKNVKGIGKNKATQFGDEILSVISEYCKENNIVQSFSDDNATEILTKIEKPNSKQASFDLLKAGKTIAEIAAEREMAVSTIEGHLAHFISTGELNIHQFVKPEKTELISAYFTKTRNPLLGPAKIALGDDVSYAELRFVLNHLKFSGQI